MRDDEIWDREMTMDEFKALDPALQRKRLDTSLRRKVAEVLRWSTRGPPKTFEWRKKAGSRTTLRQWYDPKKKLWSWSSDTPDDPKGRNRALMKKWREARTLLTAGRTIKPRNELDVWKERALALELQNTQLMAEKAKLEDRLLRAEETNRVASKKGNRNDKHPE